MFSVQELHTYYGDSHILHGVSLELPQGRAVGLLGRNGMGKTTLIRTLMGYVPARQGKVFADGREVTNSAPKNGTPWHWLCTRRARRLPQSLGQGKPADERAPWPGRPEGLDL